MGEGIVQGRKAETADIKESYKYLIGDMLTIGFL